MFTFRLLQVQSGIQQSIDNASRMMAVSLGNTANSGESDKDVNPDQEDPTLSGELSEAGLLAATIALAGVEVVNHDVPLEFIDGGAAGIYFSARIPKNSFSERSSASQMTGTLLISGRLRPASQAPTAFFPTRTSAPSSSWFICFAFRCRRISSP